MQKKEKEKEVKRQKKMKNKNKTTKKEKLTTNVNNFFLGENDNGKEKKIFNN